MTIDHVNSKKVSIYRTTSFMLDAQKDKAPEFEAMANKFIGPYFNGKMPGTGLFENELKLLLPVVLFTNPEERTFREEVRKFYDSLRTSIPYTGREYEVGLEEDNDAKLSESNMPLDVMEYIRFRHAMKSPNVAPNKESVSGANQHVWFYISDPITESAALHALSAAQDEANTIFLTIKDEKEKVDMFITLTGGDPRRYASLGDKQIELKKYLNESPKDFLKTYKQDNLELRYKVQSFVNTGVFKIVNSTQIVDVESNKLIGQNMNEAIMEIQKPAYEGSMVSWMIRMQEGLRKNMSTKRKPNR